MLHSKGYVHTHTRNHCKKRVGRAVRDDESRKKERMEEPANRENDDHRMIHHFDCSLPSPFAARFLLFSVFTGIGSCVHLAESSSFGSRVLFCCCDERREREEEQEQEK